MRAFWFISLLFFVSATAAMSDEELTPEQLKQYNREKLSIDAQSITFGTFSLKSGTMSSGEIRRWTAYKGFDKISEVDFYRTVGLDEEAERARVFHDGRDCLMWWSIGLAGGGTLFALVPLLVLYPDLVSMYPNQQARDIAEGTTLIGGLTALAGCGLVFFYLLTPDNWSPASVVQEIADSYNKMLRDTLGSQE